MNQIEILNEVWNKQNKYNGKPIAIDGEQIVVSYINGEKHYLLNENELLFDKDFLKSIFGEERNICGLGQNMIIVGLYEYIGYLLFLSDNRLEKFCELYLEYKDK